MTTVSFYGGETCGGVATRTISSAKQETTGGVGVRQMQDEAELKLENLDKDTVSFRGRNDDKKGNGLIPALLCVGALAAITVGGLAYAHKSNWMDKISNTKVREFANKISKPCHELCAKIKGFVVENYHKIFKK